MDRYRECMIGRLVYDNSRLAPLKKEAWASVKVDALNLGDLFTGKDEFLKRIQAVEHEKRDF